MVINIAIVLLMKINTVFFKIYIMKIIITCRFIKHIILCKVNISLKLIIFIKKLITSSDLIFKGGIINKLP